MFGINDLFDFQSDTLANPYIELLQNYLPFLIAVTASTWFVHSYIFKRNIAFSGFGSRRISSELIIGFFWSWVLLTAGIILLLLFDVVDIDQFALKAYRNTLFQEPLFKNRSETPTSTP